jgi:hypothetical protein
MILAWRERESKRKSSGIKVTEAVPAGVCDVERPGRKAMPISVSVCGAI